MSFTARLQIESWLKAKVPIKEIASRLGVHISTVYREIKRGEYEHKSSYTDYVYEKHYKFQKRYSPDIAQKNYQFNLAALGRTESDVKSRLHRGRERLRRELTKGEPQYEP